MEPSAVSVPEPLRGDLGGGVVGLEDEDVQPAPDAQDGDVVVESEFLRPAEEQKQPPAVERLKTSLSATKEAVRRDQAARKAAFDFVEVLASHVDRFCVLGGEHAPGALEALCKLFVHLSAHGVCLRVASCTVRAAR